MPCQALGRLEASLVAIGTRHVEERVFRRVCHAGALEYIGRGLRLSGLVQQHGEIHGHERILGALIEQSPKSGNCRV